MYAIVLAGGYATRLWPLTKGTPKALLPIAGKPILNYIIEKLQAIQPAISPIIVSTNMLFQPQFESWLSMSGYRDVMLIPDCASSEEEKPGAIKAMAKIMTTLPQDDVLVIAGDGMFEDDLTDFVNTFKHKKESIIAVYEVKSFEDAKRCATIRTSANSRILEFTEKPVEPKTKKVCGAVYILKKGITHQLSEYIATKMSVDQPGNFIQWLHTKQPIYGYNLKDPLQDIGTYTAYRACDEYFSKHGSIHEA